jgi:hypothetical protein
MRSEGRASAVRMWGQQCGTLSIVHVAAIVNGVKLNGTNACSLACQNEMAPRTKSKHTESLTDVFILGQNSIRNPIRSPSSHRPLNVRLVNTGQQLTFAGPNAVVYDTSILRMPCMKSRCTVVSACELRLGIIRVTAQGQTKDNE